MSLTETTDRTRLYLAGIVVLIAMKFVAAAFLPLFYGDEPYYWLWSRHLAWGYYDHPPAIAVLIRAGTALFGLTEFGVRFVPILLTVPATLCVWRIGKLLLGRSEDGARAALFFNLTLMVTGMTFLALPDAPVLACSAAFLWAVTEAVVGGNGRWWLVAGLFAGLGLLSKYTILFVGGGVFLWLLLTKSGRRWLTTPWPWLGGIVAALVFAPNVIWSLNQEASALSYQSSRLGYTGRGRWYYLPQFVGEQLLLASPYILILAMIGLWQATRSKDQNRLLIAFQLWPIIIFFCAYVFVDRIHRNWVDVAYPALAVAAADAFRNRGGPEFIRKAAVPAAATILALVYVQLLFHVVSLKRYDFLDHHLASGSRAAAATVAQAVALTKARGIVTTDFPTMSWLKFYLPMEVPVIQLMETVRVRNFRPATEKDFAETLLYVVPRDDFIWMVKLGFSDVEQFNDVQSPFMIYRVSGYKENPFKGHGRHYGHIP